MVQMFVNSFIRSLSYIVNESCLIDIGDFHQEYSKITKIFLTHAHLDHIYGLNGLLKQCPEIKVYTNLYGSDMLLDSKKNLSFYHEMPFVFECPEAICIVHDGMEVPLDNGTIAKAYFTPGHNPSSITWVIDDMVFTGDAYIPGIKTVTNLPGGNREQAENSIKTIKELVGGRQIYPGHKI